MCNGWSTRHHRVQAMLAGKNRPARPDKPITASGSRRKRTYASSRPTTPRTDDCKASEICEDTRSAMSGRQATMASAEKSAPRCSSLPRPPLVQASEFDARTGPATTTPETVDRSKRSRAPAEEQGQIAKTPIRLASAYLMRVGYTHMLNSRCLAIAVGGSYSLSADCRLQALAAGFPDPPSLTRALSDQSGSP